MPKYHFSGDKLLYIVNEGGLYSVISDSKAGSYDRVSLIEDEDKHLGFEINYGNIPLTVRYYLTPISMFAGCDYYQLYRNAIDTMSNDILKNQVLQNMDTDDFCRWVARIKDFSKQEGKQELRTELNKLLKG